MTQQVSDPPGQQGPLAHISHPQRNTRSPYAKAGIISLLVLVVVLLFLFSSLLVVSLVQVTGSQVKSASAGTLPTVHASPKTKNTRTVTPTPTQNIDETPTASVGIFTPNNSVIPPLQLPGEHYVIYQQQSNLYLVSSADNFSEVISTPGLVYNEAVPPILTSTGQILYSGNGIWLTDISSGTPVQIATLAPGQVITSMVLSSDGKMIAWSTEPVDGTGVIDIHAGPLASPSVVLEQSALDCPCFRIFSFMNGSGAHADNTLLLTDDRGSQEAVQYGLWSLDLSATPATPRLILDEDPEQGPLALTPLGNVLLYSSSEGAAPIPSDNSVPPDIAVLSYANSLDLTTLSGSPLAMSTTQVVLAEQDDLSNSAAYHWVTTPVFSPDAHTLAYVEFSSDAQGPYDRHSALYIVQISGSGARLHASKPRLLATSTDRLLELGSWFNSHILTFYGDGVLYALDTQSGALTTIADPGAYARILAVLDSGLA